MDSSSLFRFALLEQLQSGQWQAGDSLPTEREFSEQHQISRSTVRKVLADMKTQGLIAQRVGSGTYATGKAAGTTPAEKAPAATVPAAVPTFLVALFPKPTFYRLLSSGLADNFT